MMPGYLIIDSQLDSVSLYLSHLQHCKLSLYLFNRYGDGGPGGGEDPLDRRGEGDGDAGRGVQQLAAGAHGEGGGKRLGQESKTEARELSVQVCVGRSVETPP